AEYQESSHPVGLAVAHGLNERWNMRCRQIGPFSAKQLESVGAEALGAGLRRQIFDQAGEASESVHAEHPAARHVDIAGEYRQHRGGPDGLDAFRGMFERATP